WLLHDHLPRRARERRPRSARGRRDGRRRRLPPIPRRHAPRRPRRDAAHRDPRLHRGAPRVQRGVRDDGWHRRRGRRGHDDGHAHPAVLPRLHGRPRLRECPQHPDVLRHARSDADPRPHQLEERRMSIATARRSRAFGRMGPGERISRYALLILVLLVSIGPFRWQLSTSLKSTDEDIYTKIPQFWPSHPTLDNYARVMDAIPVWQFIGNSLFVAAFAVGGNVLFSTLAGFALSRLRFRGRRIVIGLFLATLILPGEATIIANYVTVRSVGLADTLLGVALPGMIATLNVLLMYNAFRGLPDAIDEAAVIDGANALQRFWNVSLPSVGGTVAVIAIFSFIGAWDDFLWPLIVLTSPDQFTLTIGLQYLSGTFSSDQRLIAAGSMIAFIPIAIVFAVLQRFFFK